MNRTTTLLPQPAPPVRVAEDVPDIFHMHPFIHVEQRLREYPHDRITRLVRIQWRAHPDDPQLATTPAVQPENTNELVAYTEDQLKELGQRLGVLVVPHEFILIPQSVAAEICQDFLSKQDLKETITNQRRYPFIPDNLVLGCEVAIVDPVENQPVPLVPNLGNTVWEYLNERKALGTLGLRDINRADQFVYGTIRGQAQNQAQTYIVDIEPQFGSQPSPLY